MCWMTSKAIALLDIYECLHLIYLKSSEELDTIDLEQVEMVYATPFYKAVATGGNVSRAMVSISNRACYNSMISSGKQIILLGLNSIHVVSIRSWSERIDYFVKKGLHAEALEIAERLYHGRAKMVLDSSQTMDDKQKIIMTKVRAIVTNYLDRTIHEHNKNEIDIANFSQRIGSFIRYCFSFDLKDIIFAKAFKNLSESPTTLGIFFRSLQPFILEDKLPNMPSDINKKLIDYYSDCEDYDTLETIILKIHPTSLNVPQILSICLKHYLFSTYLYLHNKIMQKYDEPFEELLVLLQDFLRSGRKLDKKIEELGNKLLVYLTSCLTGEAYYWGDISYKRANQVKDEIYYLLIRPQGSLPGDTTPHANLKAFLHFNTRDFLNVLSIAFSQSGLISFSAKQKQDLVYLLREIILESSDFKPPQIGAFFTFLARLLAVPNNVIKVSRTIFEQVIEYLINPDDETRVEERQLALLELYKGKMLSKIESSRLLQLADKAKFYQVCEQLYENSRQFDKILTCYLDDHTRNSRVFSYISLILDSNDYTKEEKLSLKNKIIEELEKIAEIDIEMCNEILFKYFYHDIESIIFNPKFDPCFIYNILQEIYSKKESNSFSQSDKTLSVAVADKYVELATIYDADNLLLVLENTQGYQVSKALELCYNKKLMNAVGYLLEKSGDVYGSFKIIFDDLQNKMMKVYDAILHGRNLATDNYWLDFREKLRDAITFCQRHCRILREGEKESLWYSLLDILLGPQRQMKQYIKKVHVEAIKEAISDLLLSMSGHLPLPNILRQILNEPICTAGKIEEIRPLVIGMLESCAYETTILSTCVKIHRKDAHELMEKFCLESRKAVACHETTCHKCRQQIEPSSRSNIVAFVCGHLFHDICLFEKEFWGVRHKQNSGCPICQKSRIPFRREHSCLSVTSSAATASTKSLSMH